MKFHQRILKAMENDQFLRTRLINSGEIERAQIAMPSFP